jgi:hypothetical protein
MIIALNWRLCFVAKGTHILLLPCTDMPCTTANSLDEPVVFSLLASAIAHEGDSMVQLLCLPHAARLLVHTCITLAHLSLSKAAKVTWYMMASCCQRATNCGGTLSPKAHSIPVSLCGYQWAQIKHSHGVTECISRLCHTAATACAIACTACVATSTYCRAGIDCTPIDIHIKHCRLYIHFA